MRILIYGLNYAPEWIGTGKASGELGAWLADQGHEVRVVAAPPYYPDWRVQDGYSAFSYRREAVAGARVIRCPLWVPRRPSGLRRVLHLLSFALTSLPVVLWQALTWRPQVVLVVAPTLLAAPGGVLAARLARASSCLHVQDFEVDAAFGLGLLKSGRLHAVCSWLEAKLLRRFDQVSSISPNMCRALTRKGVASEQLFLLPNSVDTEEIRPLPRPNLLRQAYGIGEDTTVALYAGSMGTKQGLETLVAAARKLEDRSDLRFVLAGTGPARAELERLASGLSNLLFLPLQPPERINELLNLADIHLLPQRRDAADLVMPSKLSGMLASGRPVVAGAAAGTQLASAIQGCGLVVPPEDGAAMAAAVVQLTEDKDYRLALGRAARQEALANWDKSVILARFTVHMERLAAADKKRQGRPVVAARQ